MSEHRDVFEARDVSIGDVIQYPAVLRREHNHVRTRLLVTRSNGLKLWGRRVDFDEDEDEDAREYEYVLTPSQITGNGVRVERFTEQDA